jgi:hypothetical protein
VHRNLLPSRVVLDKPFEPDNSTTQVKFRVSAGGINQLGLGLGTCLNPGLGTCA